MKRFADLTQALALTARTSLLMVGLLSASAHAASSEAAGRVELDETVISGNQELPKVLYILPWRDPDGLPDIQLQAEQTEMEVFRRLYPPAYRRELKYFETLEERQSSGADSTATE